MRPKHLPAYLDEFAFRHSRRKTIGLSWIAARVIESLVAKPPRTMRQIINATTRCRGSRQLTWRQPELRAQACGAALSIMLMHK